MPNHTREITKKRCDLHVCSSNLTCWQQCFMHGFEGGGHGRGSQMGNDLEPHLYTQHQLQHICKLSETHGGGTQAHTWTLWRIHTMGLQACMNLTREQTRSHTRCGCPGTSCRFILPQICPLLVFSGLPKIQKMLNFTDTCCCQTVTIFFQEKTGNPPKQKKKISANFRL